MGLAAIATLVLYNHSFGLMEELLSSISRTPSGYLLFHLSLHSLALAVMLPATICAGMTLPLLTTILLRQGHGEKSFGTMNLPPA